MKNKTLHLLLSMLFLLASCAKDVDISKRVVGPAKYLKDIRACFLLYNMKTNAFDKVIGEENCDIRYPAFSSFKVPLAVMAFDSGVLKDEYVVLKWDGVKHSREVLNQDHNAITFMRDSVVWFSQRITQKLGKEKLQDYLNRFDYGNKNLSEGIKTAWLTSPARPGKGLEVTAYEQVEFMKKLWSEKLPVSERSIALTQKITYLETTPKGYKFSGKTGSNFFDKEKFYHLGWFISHLEKGDEEYIAVTNIRDIKPFYGGGYGGPRAKEITKKILISEGLW